ncbi:hypothetical protein GCM10011588_16810 [Nocardia jinanensis]|uniref:Uncharacterized protein n=1 Tax=Nocardia jinanensis TaxID=382504 RepID=A0A917RDY2_9NOCA|nr:hypothetical protein GCM10011588_16810 [Nocardia jinanensis]
MEGIAGGQSGAQVQELLDLGALGQRAHGAGEPAPVHEVNIALPWGNSPNTVECRTVYPVVVLAAQAVVVDAGDARSVGVGTDGPGTERWGGIDRHRASVTYRPVTFRWATFECNTAT